MGQDIIKDFVKKQTTAISIGVPKEKPLGEELKKNSTDGYAGHEQGYEDHPLMETSAKNNSSSIKDEHRQENQAPAEVSHKAHIGRPKSEVEKVKMSVYVPAEAKAKLIKIQHENYRQNLNDVLLEAINDILKKYGE